MSKTKYKICHLFRTFDGKLDSQCVVTDEGDDIAIVIKGMTTKCTIIITVLKTVETDVTTRFVVDTRESPDATD